MVSTLALVVGLVVVDVFKPGAGMNIDVATLDTSASPPTPSSGRYMHRSWTSS